MTTHAHMPADRSLLPRSLLPRRPAADVQQINWRFELGAVVEFWDELGVVVDRSATSAGRHLYTLKIVNPQHGREVRVVRDGFIERAPDQDAVDSAP